MKIINISVELAVNLQNTPLLELMKLKGPTTIIPENPTKIENNIFFPKFP